jgi:polar amino acid transport system permease protein
MTNDLLSSLSSADFLRAAFTTVWLTAAAQAAGTLGGALLAPVRMAGNPVARAFASFYLLIFRGTPELLQLIAWYAVLPLAGVNLNLVEIAVIGLGANEAARMVEIIRGALLAVNSGQGDAARTVGLTRVQALRYVILPQMMPTVIAGLGNEVNIMFKTTSLVSVIGMTELLGQSEIVAQTARNPLGPYLAALVYYLLLTTIWAGCQGLLTNRGPDIRGAGRSLAGAWWNALSGEL